MTTYGTYLALGELLELQRPLSTGPEHDEMLFIVIHQSYELWFKQILHELRHLKDLLKQRSLAKGQHTMKRILVILKVLVAKVDILETMTPLEFLSFRGLLDGASGFQSSQFRELEFLLGYRRPQLLENFQGTDLERTRLQQTLSESSLWETFLGFLRDGGYAVEDSLGSSLVNQAIFQQIYRSSPEIAEFCERLVDLDEGLQEWRYRHVKMVQRTIGAKMGTGGSSGVEYLMKTISAPLFPDLWEIRSQF